MQIHLERCNAKVYGSLTFHFHGQRVYTFIYVCIVIRLVKRYSQLNISSVLAETIGYLTDICYLAFQFNHATFVSKTYFNRVGLFNNIPL